MRKGSCMGSLFKTFFRLLIILIVVGAFALGGYVVYKGGINGIRTHFDGDCQTVGYTEYYLPFGIKFKKNDDSVGEHVYGEGTVLKEPTCTEEGDVKYICTLCGDEKHVREKIPHSFGESWTYHDDEGHWKTCTVCSQVSEKFPHAFDEGTVLKTPTCLEKGDILFSCECGQSYHEEKFGEHAYPETWEHDSAKHWQICSVCSEESEKITHEYRDEVLVKATCVSDGTTKHSCKICDYSYLETVHASDISHGSGSHDYSVVSQTPPTCQTKGSKTYRCANCDDVYTDEIAMLDHHDYEGHLCKYCMRDELLDYIDEFTTKGSASDPIILDTREKAICYIDYTTAYEITAADGVYAKPDFAGSVSISELSTILGELCKERTSANCPVQTSVASGFSTLCAVYCDGTKLAQAATRTNDGTYYTDLSVPQADSVQFPSHTKTRSDSAILPYESRTQTLSVTTTNKLFYALSHGYKPVPTANSPAEKVLKEARKICIENIDDTMTEIEKLYAIYSWLAKNVSYDTGAANNVGDDWTKYHAWYLEGVFLDHVAVCDAIAKSFSVLANIENVECLVAAGNSHAWNKVYIDANGDGVKEWFVVDPTHANAVGSTYETFEIAQFLITDARKASLGYDADNLSDCVANTDFEVFKFLHYGNGTPSESNDYFIESYAEFQALYSAVKPLIDASPDKISVQFVISEHYVGEDYSHAISTGYSRSEDSYNGNRYVTLIFK